MTHSIQLRLKKKIRQKTLPLYIIYPLLLGGKKGGNGGGKDNGDRDQGNFGMAENATK